MLCFQRLPIAAGLLSRCGSVAIRRRRIATGAGPQVTSLALRQHFVSCAVPFVGFGFVDNSVMIQAGNAIDLTLGVAFGLSTMAAAACGQICSDIAGVAGGGVIEAAATRLGLPTPQFTPAQRKLLVVKRVGMAGQILGVAFGCALGLCNLLLIDTSRAAELKVATDPAEGEYEVRITNRLSEENTVLTVTGPDRHGLVASVCGAIASHSCSIVEVHGTAQEGGLTHDTFHVRRRGKQVGDDDLADLGQTVLDACESGMSPRLEKLKVANQSLRDENARLRMQLGLEPAPPPGDVSA